MIQKVCEVCGEKATCFTCDTQEIAPSVDSKGQLWRKWIPLDSHSYCDAHYVDPVKHYLDGRSVRGVEDFGESICIVRGMEAMRKMRRKEDE